MTMINGDLRGALRQLRDKLALETPRARSRTGVPKELVRRMESTLRRAVAALSGPFVPKDPRAVQELFEDTVAESHLVLRDWERWVEQAQKPARPASERRKHVRKPTSVTVKLLRHEVRE